ncbi:hypothetical protein EYZ11_001030 [Aspergillus tanneri]|uniref:Carrier domain-containing protein n=1 Tax=Aspergillus tanneri TaxID=1220188 RepID=A0A4S3JVM5_9EURO|nr:hypothetical protein EYZ11_001030 [Aspergillus tanneri]
MKKTPALLEDEDFQRNFKGGLFSLAASHIPEADGRKAEEIFNIGIDSLMAIELKMWIRRNFDIEINTVEVTQGFGRFAHQACQSKGDFLGCGKNQNKSPNGLGIIH